VTGTSSSGVAAADAAVAFCEVFAAFAAGFAAASAVRFVAPAAGLSEDDECETGLATVEAVMHKLEPEPKTMSNHVDITCETDKNKDRQPATTKLQQ
jgi:hypothetical protein